MSRRGKTSLETSSLEVRHTLTRLAVCPVTERLSSGLEVDLAAKLGSRGWRSLVFNL